MRMRALTSWAIAALLGLSDFEHAAAAGEPGLWPDGSAGAPAPSRADAACSPDGGPACLPAQPVVLASNALASPSPLASAAEEPPFAPNLDCREESTASVYADAVGRCDLPSVAASMAPPESPTPARDPLLCDGGSCFPLDPITVPTTNLFSHGQPAALAFALRPPLLSARRLRPLPTLPLPTRPARRIDRPPRAS